MKNEEDEEEDTNEEEKTEGKRELFVGNLSFNASEDTLMERFSQYGKVTNVKLPMANGRSKGIAFVEFAKPADAQKALTAENGQDLDGRSLKLDFSGGAPPPR